MGNNKRKEICFLSLGCPWPAFSGASLRKQGLIKEMSKEYDLDLGLFLNKPLDDVQRRECEKHAAKTTEIQVCNNAYRIALYSILKNIPYHSSTVLLSLNDVNKALIEEINEKSIVYCAGSFFSVLRNKANTNKHWVIDQFDSELEYWKIRSHEYNNLLKKLLSQINYSIINNKYEEIYSGIACVICVSEEDKYIFEKRLSGFRVNIIENGVDCGYFQPGERRKKDKTCRLLFTGTSNERNIRALKNFTGKFLPKLGEEIGDIELVVAGDFDEKARKLFSGFKNIFFTGRVTDIRPFYDSADVFINPFHEVYGSKVKLAQALSMGLCVVTTRNGSRGFGLKDGETALIADNDSEFYDKLVFALRNATIREEIGRKGREFTELHLDWAVLGLKLREILRPLA